MKPTVLILGGTGMLGSMMVDVLGRNENLNVLATDRRVVPSELMQKIKNVIWYNFEVNSDMDEKLLNEADIIINCIGTIKPHINEGSSDSILNAIKINSVFPFVLAQHTSAKIIQIGTDCVFSGSMKYGAYNEFSPHDPSDIYGKTKSLGELAPLTESNIKIIRCSIIGPEIGDGYSLLNWFKNTDQKELNGYVNHLWNGVTTLAFAKICGYIAENVDIVFPALRSISHLVPADSVSKFKMLEMFAYHFDKDIQVNIGDSKPSNRVLSTEYDFQNIKLWEAAGYKKVPTIEDLVSELSTYVKNSEVFN